MAGRANPTLHDAVIHHFAATKDEPSKTIAINAHIYDKLEQLASQKGLSVTEFIGQLVARELQQNYPDATYTDMLVNDFLTQNK